jgi:CBS domain-containing protein
MRVQDVMTKEVSYCNPSTNAAAAAEIMWTQNCGSLPIVEDSGRVVGMITDRDLFIALGTQNRRPAEFRVGEIMNRELSLCAPDDDVRLALRTMAQKQAHRLPVVDKDGALRGILSIDDVVLRADVDGLATDVVKTMKAICDRPRASEAEG